MTKVKPDHDSDRDHANDNDERATTPSPAGGALTSLAALQTALKGVDTTSVAGRSGLPMLQFKRDGDGTWMHGQKRTVVEDGSRWAANPMSFRWGYIAFTNDNKVAGERLVSIAQPKPEITELPNKGDAEWTEQWAVTLKCLDGTDAGTEVIYKPTTVGGIQAVAGMVDSVRDRLNGGQHDGKVVPIVELAKGSYQHGQYGRVWTPVLEIVGWMPLEGPAPAPAPEPTPPPSSEQPRRRRVA
jgi:hypothetical protein